MKLKLYAIRDIKVGQYMNLLELQNDLVAKRAVGLSLNDPRSSYYQYKSDVELYRLGEFDSETGSLIPEAPCYLGNGIELSAPYAINPESEVKSDE